MTIECPYSPERIEKAIEGFKRFDPADPGMDWAVIADVQTAREVVRGLDVKKALTPGAEWFLAGMRRAGPPYP